jgi:alpha-tubulin suppressor-like RCC1 family protein
MLTPPTRSPDPAPRSAPGIAALLAALVIASGCRSGPTATWSHTPALGSPSVQPAADAPRGGSDAGGPLATTAFAASPQVAAASRFACALGVDGRVACWGQLGGRKGLGADQAASAVRGERATDMGLSRVVQLSLGDAHGCALLEGGEVACWGQNERGQLALGVRDQAWHPVARVPGLRDVKRLGEPPLCAVRADDSAVCWGDDRGGRLGRLDNGEISGPAPIAGLGAVQSVSLGPAHGCAITTDGDAICWGENRHGQASPPRTPVRLSESTTGADGAPARSASFSPPARVAGLPGVVQVVSGDRRSCALSARGQVFCWGQVGAGDEALLLSPPAPVQGLSDAVRITVDTTLACGLRRDGTVACWGDLLHGGPWSWDIKHVVAEPDAPTDVPGVGGARYLATGSSYSCALRGDGAVLCWGSNESGIAGGSADDPPAIAPRVVPGLSLSPPRSHSDADAVSGR